MRPFGANLSVVPTRKEFKKKLSPLLTTFVITDIKPVIRRNESLEGYNARVQKWRGSARAF